MYAMCRLYNTLCKHTLYRTQYIQGIGLPVTYVDSEMFAHVLSILSLHKHLYIYKCLSACCHDEIHLVK